MKGIIKISILTLVLGCNQSKIKTPIQKKVESVIDTIAEEKNETKNYLKRVKSTNGEFTLADLTNEFCLVFGQGNHESESAWSNINLDSLKGFIVDPTYEEFINLKELRTQRIHIDPKNDSLPLCQFKNSLIIPFTSNEDRSHLTIWKIISADSIQFVRAIQPSIERRYTNIVSIKAIKLKDKNYLSIYMKGGEGGSNWDEQIIAKFDGKEKFEIISNEAVGYCHDCGDWAKIQLEINSDGFEMTEIRDSMKLIDKRWVRVWRKNKVRNTIKVKTEENNR